MTEQARSRVRQFITARWLSLGGYRDRDIDRFVSAVVPVVLSGERTVAQLTNAYLAQVESLVLGESVAPEGRTAVVGAGLRGVDPAVVYRRPAVALYTALAAGVPFADAVQQGLKRAVDIAMTDLQLAKTHAVAGSTRVQRFKRTLSGLENCSLCALASQHTYYRGDLLPIHSGCDCGVQPLFGDEPSDDSYPAGVEVRTHGELGPVLIVEGHNFTGPGDF